MEFNSGFKGLMLGLNHRVVNPINRYILRLFLDLMFVDPCVHHSTIYNEKSNKMQQCIKILLFHIYTKLNMFRATHRPSSGA